MGNTNKKEIDPKLLKAPCPLSWDEKNVRRLIVEKRIAPFFATLDDEEGEECQICMNVYDALNRSMCCRKEVCSECFFKIKPQNGCVGCPFCNRPNWQVQFFGPKSQEEKERELAEDNHVKGLLAKARQSEEDDARRRALSAPTTPATAHKPHPRAAATDPPVRQRSKKDLMRTSSSSSSDSTASADSGPAQLPMSAPEIKGRWMDTNPERTDASPRSSSLVANDRSSAIANLLQFNNEMASNMTEEEMEAFMIEEAIRLSLAEHNSNNKDVANTPVAQYSIPIDVDQASEPALRSSSAPLSQYDATSPVLAPSPLGSGNSTASVSPVGPAPPAPASANAFAFDDDYIDDDFELQTALRLSRELASLHPATLRDDDLPEEDHPLGMNRNDHAQSRAAV